MLLLNSAFLSLSFCFLQVLGLAKRALCDYSSALTHLAWSVNAAGVLIFNSNSAAAAELCMLAATSGLSDDAAYAAAPLRLLGTLLAHAFPGLASAQDPDAALDLARGGLELVTAGPLAACGPIPTAAADSARAKRALRALLETTHALLSELFSVCKLSHVLPLLPPVLHTLLAPGLEEEVNRGLLDALHRGVDRVGYAYWRARQGSRPTSQSSAAARPTETGGGDDSSNSSSGAEAVATLVAADPRATTPSIIGVADADDVAGEADAVDEAFPALMKR